MTIDRLPEATSPEVVHWDADSSPEPTFPEGAWTSKTALVETALEGQKYQVKFEGVYWTAIATPPELRLRPGDTVVVLGREGTELVVQRQSEGQPGLNPPEVGIG